MNVVLEARNITHSFSGLHVLMGVNLSVERGERHAILGPNGAGKTTLFNLITGGYNPSSGEIFFEKMNVTKKSIHERAREGLVRSFQITNIFPKLTAFETLRASVLSRRNVRLNFLRHVNRMSAVKEEVESLLERLGLQDQRETFLRENWLTGNSVPWRLVWRWPFPPRFFFWTNRPPE